MVSCSGTSIIESNHHAVNRTSVSVGSSSTTDLLRGTVIEHHALIWNIKRCGLLGDIDAKGVVDLDLLSSVNEVEALLNVEEPTYKVPSFHDMAVNPFEVEEGQIYAWDPDRAYRSSDAARPTAHARRQAGASRSDALLQSAADLIAKGKINPPALQQRPRTVDDLPRSWVAVRPTQTATQPTAMPSPEEWLSPYPELLQVAQRYQQNKRDVKEGQEIEVEQWASRLETLLAVQPTTDEQHQAAETLLGLGGEDAPGPSNAMRGKSRGVQSNSSVCFILIVLDP